MKNCNTSHPPTSRNILRITCVAVLGMVCAVALPQAAQAQTVTPPPVQDNIQVPAGSKAFLLGHGVGTQNSVCLPASSIGSVAWTLFTPQATLFDDQEEQLTTHFFSPNPFESSPSPFESGIVRLTWPGLPGHEHCLGAGDRILVGPEIRHAGSDTLAPGASSGSLSGTDGRQQTVGDDLHPTVEHRRRCGPFDRLSPADGHRS